ncbi:hypothetical protein Tco_0601972 [Tanacetum coccineum]
MPSVTQPSKIFTFMRKHSPKFSCRITPLTPSRLEVVTALAAEEEHSTKSSFLGLRVLQGMIKGLLIYNGGTAASLGTARLQESQNLKKQKRRRKKQRKNVSSVKLGRNKVEGTLSEEHYVQEEDTADPFFDDIVDKDAAVASDIDRKSNEQKSSSTLLSNSSYGSGSKNKLKLLKFLLLFLDQEMRRVARKIQAEWDAEEERKRLLQRFYSNGLREWKGCGCNDKKEMKRVFQGKEKITISEEQPFKKLKLRTETVDEIRNYLRVVDFEKCAQERESLEGISMITELQIERIVFKYIELHSGNDFLEEPEVWEIVRWRLNEPFRVCYTLELEDGTMIHMLAEEDLTSVQGTVNSQGTAELQRTADFQGTDDPHDAAAIPTSPNDYTPTDASQTSGGDEGLLDIYALNREVRRLKKQTLTYESKGQSSAMKKSKYC